MAAALAVADDLKKTSKIKSKVRMRGWEPGTRRRHVLPGRLFSWLAVAVNSLGRLLTANTELTVASVRRRLHRRFWLCQRRPAGLLG